MNQRTSSSPSHTPADELRDLVELAYEARWLLVTLMASAAVIASLIAYRLPDVYTANVKIMMGDPSKNPLTFKEISDEGDVRQRGDVSQLEILTSRPVLAKTVQDLKLAEHYHIPASSIAELEAAEKLKKNLKAEWVRNTQVVRIGVDDKVPEFSAQIANALAQNFIQTAYWKRISRSEQILKWLPADQAKDASPEAVVEQISSLSDPKIIESLPSVMNDPVIAQIKQQLVSLDAEQQELSKRYKEKHPKMKEMNAKISYLKSEMKSQTEKIIMNLKAGLTGAFGVNNIQVIEEAVRPIKPSGPPRLLIVGGSTGAAFILGLLYSGLSRRLNRKIRSSENLAHLWIPFLGYLPVLKTLRQFEEKGQMDLSSIINYQSREWDDVVNFKSSVEFSLPAERKKRILLTSVLPGEGKSTVSSLLAMSFAQMGQKTLLIDCDMRRPSIHVKFGVRAEGGLSELLSQGKELKSLVKPMPKIENLHLLTAGHATPNPAVLLRSELLDKLLLEADSLYDKVIIDAPPALHIADALGIVAKVHGTVLVFLSGKVHEEGARKLIERIRLGKGEVIGGVINCTNLKEVGNNYYHHYDQYKRYYKHQPASKN